MYDYKTNVIRISELADSLQDTKHGKGSRDESEAQRIKRLMDAGDVLRSRKSDILALGAVHKISLGRSEDAKSRKQPLCKLAHVMRSLKHPDEAWTLRRIYGPGFFLIGVVTSRDQRARYLETEKGCSREEIDDLFKRDEHGGSAGQRTRDTFQLSDVFVPVDDVSALSRFLRLVFAAPYDTPTPDEHAMFLAFSSALRSADLSRQVGAVVISNAGDVIGVRLHGENMAGR